MAANQDVATMPVGRADRTRRVGQVLRRVAALLIVILSGLGVLICLVGVIGVWRVRGPLVEGGTTNLGRLESALGSASSGVQTAQAGLDAVNAERVADAGRTIAAIPEILVQIDATLATLDQLPFVSVPTIDSAQLARIGERVNSLSASVEEARQRRASGGVEDDLQSLRATAADLERHISTAQARVAAAREGWPGWINWGAALLTLLFIWLGVAQTSLGRLAWTHWWRAEG